MKKRYLPIVIDSFINIALFFSTFPSLPNIISNTNNLNTIYKIGEWDAFSYCIRINIQGTHYNYERN